MITDREKSTPDHNNTTASTWDSLASKWVTNTHGVILTKCGCGCGKKMAATHKKRVGYFFRQWIEDNTKVHAAARGHQSSWYKDPEIRVEFQVIPIEKEKKRIHRRCRLPRGKIKIKWNKTCHVVCCGHTWVRKIKTGNQCRLQVRNERQDHYQFT